MANIDIEVGGRRYNVACRDGEEDHLASLAAIVDQRAQDAGTAMGSLTETRQLLLAALLIADDLNETRSGGKVEISPAAPDPAIGDALERLAEHAENLADRVEQSLLDA